MKLLRMRRARLIAVAVTMVGGTLLTQVPTGVAQADNKPLPGSCKLHANKVVNPGCVNGLTEAVNDIEAPEAPADPTAPGLTYPNLVPNVTFVTLTGEWIYDPPTNTFVQGPPDLRFDTWAQNAGTVPVDLIADHPENVESSTVSQCVSWTAGYVCRERQQAGGFTWHAEHEHFHFNDFADYQLRRVGPGNVIDYSAAGLVAVSEKVSFCLMDSRQYDESSTAIPTYHACSNVRQGVTPGWTDIYGSDLPGQSFPGSALTDGRYAVVVDMNTTGTLLETDTTDNRVETIVDVSMTNRTVTIVETRWP